VVVTKLMLIHPRHYTRSSHEATDSAIGNLSNKTDKLHKQESKLDYQLEVLRSKINSVDDDSVSPLPIVIRINVTRS
jgi:CII-binding regulator of phage lambda lysogenization HflD